MNRENLGHLWSVYEMSDDLLLLLIERAEVESIEFKKLSDQILVCYDEYCLGKINAKEADYKLQALLSTQVESNGYEMALTCHLSLPDNHLFFERRIIGKLYALLDNKMTEMKEFGDNYRIASESNYRSVKQYKEQQKDGCCGFFDDEIVIDGVKYFYGCNYGH